MRFAFGQVRRLDGLADVEPMRVMVFIRVIRFLACEISEALDEVLFEGSTLFYLRNRRLAFSALELIPLLGELRIIEPKFPFRQFFDFRFGIRRRRSSFSPTLWTKSSDGLLDGNNPVRLTERIVHNFIA